MGDAFWSRCCLIWVVCLVLLVSAAHADNAELRKMYETDQADRAAVSTQKWDPADWSRIATRDRERRARVSKMLDANEVVSAADFYHAAMIFQHGETPSDYLQAHVLSSIAAFNGNLNARWLAAASLDRYLNSIKQPQIFGTQYWRIDNKWTMEPYDRSLPAAIRRAYQVPTLEQSLERLEKIKRGE